MSKEWGVDYKELVQPGSAVSPADLDRQVLNYVKKDLNPSHSLVFSKLLLIQGFIGFLTLLFCPQFNLSLTNSHEVFHYFHYHFGESICMAICGAIFIGIGAAFAGILLKNSEIRKVSESKFMYYFCICSISLLSFMAVGVEIYLGMTAFWLVGAYLSGLLFFECGHRAKSLLLQT